MKAGQGLARMTRPAGSGWCGAMALLLALSATAAEESVNAQIHGAITAALQAQWPGQELDIHLTQPDPRLRLSPCTAPLAVEPLRPGPLGSAMTLAVACAAPQPWRVYVPVQVRSLTDVVVATRQLAAGQILTAQDVAIGRRRMTDLSYGYLKHPEAAIGSSLRRPVAEGGVILPALLAQPMLIRRGQQVVIEAANGLIQVNGAGEALTDGRVGERLKVRNLASGRIVEGRVQTDGRVRVEW